jgi:hypothetical protein
MNVHGRPAVLPEVQEFLSTFQVGSRRPEGQEALERYTPGLRTELSDKHWDCGTSRAGDQCAGEGCGRSGPAGLGDEGESGQLSAASKGWRGTLICCGTSKR